MNTSESNTHSDAQKPRPLSTKVVGVGGAGGVLLDIVAEGRWEGASFIAINTDARGMLELQHSEKVVLGTTVTRGLGAGGDPDVGHAAAREDFEKLKALCADTDVLFLLVGLGGGTGTGAAPVLAEAARACGTLVIALATLPFEFEGARRQRQAQLGLRHLKAAADIVLSFPNQAIFKLIDGSMSFLDTFKLTNRLVSEGVLSVWTMLNCRSLLQVDFADLCAVTRGRHTESRFAVLEASGNNKSNRVLQSLEGHPLVGTDLLREAQSVLVNVRGGPELSMNDVNAIMAGINRHANGRLLFGASIDPALEDSVKVTVIASCEKLEDAEEREVQPSRVVMPLFEPSAESMPESRSAAQFAAPAEDLPEARRKEIAERQARRGRGRKKSAGWSQGQLPLDIVSRGRFEKSEPTIHQGQDLDIPTYIRRNVPLN